MALIVTPVGEKNRTCLDTSTGFVIGPNVDGSPSKLLSLVLT